MSLRQGRPPLYSIGWSADRNAAHGRIEYLYDEISRQSDVILQNVLMFLHDGREVRQEILEEAWERGGEGGTSSVRLVSLTPVLTTCIGVEVLTLGSSECSVPIRQGDVLDGRGGECCEVHRGSPAASAIALCVPVFISLLYCSVYHK